MSANWASIGMHITTRRPVQQVFSELVLFNFVQAGLSSSRRHLQSGGASIAGSLHGINSGNLMIPPAPLPPTSVPPPPHICIAGVDMGMGMGMGHGLMSNGEDDEDDLELDEDQLDADIFINDVHFDEDNIDHVNQMANV